MSVHFREVCDRGYVGRQCRCPGPKSDVRVACWPEHDHTIKATEATEDSLMEGSVYLFDHTVIDGMVDVRDPGWVRIEKAVVRGDGPSAGVRMSIPVDRVLRIEWAR